MTMPQGHEKIILLLVGCVLTLTVSSQWPLTVSQRREIVELVGKTNIPPRMREQTMMLIYINGSSGQFAYRAAVMNKMLEEANYFADKLQLPAKRPIQITDVKYPIVLDPWSGVVREPLSRGSLPDTIFSNRIYDASIPREQRLRALEFGASGVIETTNFFFSFQNGRIREVLRLSEHEVEYLAHDLDKLIGKPSLIDTNGAYQLATQWLATVDMDMTALNKLKWTVNQLHYRARGATNYVTLPLYYVNFGEKHFHWPKGSSMQDHPEPLVSVEVLGTTKELQDLTINDLSFSHRPLLLITNAIDLIRTPNPPVKQLPSSHSTNSP